MMKFHSFRSLIKDRCKVERKMLVEENFITEQKNVVIYRDMKCKLSYKGQKILQQDQIASFTNAYKLYYSDVYELKTGDKITIENKQFYVGEIIRRNDFYVAELNKKEKA